MTTGDDAKLRQKGARYYLVQTKVAIGEMGLDFAGKGGRCPPEVQRKAFRSFVGTVGQGSCKSVHQILKAQTEL